jgi:Leucine-rich repeat (LRR) protein
MLTPEQNDSITRKQFAELKFNHQAQKAHRKGKLVEVAYKVSPDEPPTVLLVDPAFVNFMYDMNPSTADDSDHILLLTRLTSLPQKNHDVVSKIFELVPKGAEDAILETIQRCTMQDVYKAIVEADPTPNKEYVQWILTMYTRILKDRVPKTTFEAEENTLGGFAYLFFENLYKVADALKIFHKIKNTKLLSTDHKDIYTYKSIEHFVEVVFSVNLDVSTEINPDVLNPNELAQLASKTASILYQDPDWVIVHTVTQGANSVFGEQTTWCTAGTRWGGMFDNYNKQGKLFVLIKNKVGTQSHIKSNPENRLQFHFESDQYMNALDRRIDILKFFKDNYGVKNYFRDYIVNTLMKKSPKIEDMIKTLNKFGMVKDLVPILKDMKVKQLDLSGVIGKNGEFELETLGEVITLEELIIRDCELEHVPEPIRRLKNLKELRLSGNKITTIPTWINELKTLEVLNVMKNQIEQPFDISGLSNLQEVHVGFNKKLHSLPTGIKHLKMLQSVDCSLCDITSVNDEVLECKGLIQFNVTRNKNLKDIPDQLVNLPNLLFLGLDETNIPASRIQYLESIKKNQQTVIS